MQFTLHKDFSEINETEWNTLVEQSITNVPFLRQEYLSGWWQTRGGGEWQNAQLILISARDENRLVGIAPLFLSEHDGQRALMLLGSIEISDYLDFIVRSDDLSRFVSALIDFLASSLADHWHGFDLYNLPDSSPTLAALKADSAQRGWAYHEEIYHPSLYIPLSGDFEAYLAGVEKKQRHEIRRKMRRAEESNRGVRWYIVHNSQDINTEIDSFISLMEHDAQKQEFLTPAMREQISNVIRTANQHGWLWLAFLEVDGQKAAAMFCFDYNNKLWGYNSGVNRDFMDVSPGWVLLAYILQWASENNRTEFDLMRGDEEYKYRFGAIKRFVMRAKLTRA